MLIGTRGSPLALAQANTVKSCLEKKNPKIVFKLVVIKTKGDEFQSVELFKKNQTGVFTKAIERKLLAREIDLAVHSLKDLPTELPEGLVVGAYPKRFDPSDALISRRSWSLKRLPKGARIGTGSPRRKRQLERLRPDLKLYDLRGNLDTRASKVLKENNFDAIVVAQAGLLRLKKYLKFARRISPKELLPAVGQGALALEVRGNDVETLRIVCVLNHKNTQRQVVAERRLLQVLQGGCRVPVGVYSEIKKRKLAMTAAVFSTRNRKMLRAHCLGSLGNPAKIGEKLAQKLLKLGAGVFLKEARSS